MSESSSGVPFKDYLDSQLAEVRRAVDLAAASAAVEGVPLREYVEAIFEKHEMATQMAEREREKAAEVLANQLARSIKEGDDRLREHITQQVVQIKSALDSAEKLEVQRLAAALDRVTAVQRELEIQQNASAQAIAKAEKATEDRFRVHNAWREQMAMERALFLPREVAEAQFAEMRRSIAELTEKISKVV